MTLNLICSLKYFGSFKLYVCKLLKRRKLDVLELQRLHLFEVFSSEVVEKRVCKVFDRVTKEFVDGHEFLRLDWSEIWETWHLS